MSHAPAMDSSVLDEYQAEWRMLRERPHTVLLEGPVAATNAVLLLLQPHIPETITWNRPHAPVTAHNGQTGVLILREASALSGDDQKQLREWLEREGSGAHIVSTTERPLFALVAAGLFDETLYYRLNTMLLPVGPGNPRDRTVPILTSHQLPPIDSRLQLA
jgi:hypothetical protein